MRDKIKSDLQEESERVSENCKIEGWGRKKEEDA